MRTCTHRIILLLLILYVFVVSASDFKWLTSKNNEGIFSSFLNKTLDKGYTETARKKKKHKFAMNLMLAIFMAKSVLLPLVFKAMLIMTGVSVIMSTFSLIIASLVSYHKLAWKHAGPTIKVIKNSHGWSHDDGVVKGYYEKYETIPEVKLFENDDPEHYHYYEK